MVVSPLPDSSEYRRAAWREFDTNAEKSEKLYSGGESKGEANETLDSAGSCSRDHGVRGRPNATIVGLRDALQDGRRPDFRGAHQRSPFARRRAHLRHGL